MELRKYSFARRFFKTKKPKYVENIAKLLQKEFSLLNYELVETDYQVITYVNGNQKCL